MTDLKPCPFCGGKEIRYMEEIGRLRPYWKMCINCRVNTQMEKSPEECLEAWNKRVNMTKFDIAFDYTIQYEGTKFVDDPDDEGGATKFGISEKFIKGLKDDDLLPVKIDKNRDPIWYKKGTEVIGHIKDYIHDLTIELAKLIYQKYFWLPIYDQIENQDICNYIFDMHVQHGKKKAAELTQRAISAYLGNGSFKIDGIFGNETLSFINDFCFYNCDGTNIAKITLIAVRESFYRCIVAHDKSQEQFLGGWLKRAYGEKL